MPRQKKMTIPTLITLGRFFLVPVFAYFFIQEKYFLSLCILLIAGLSDLIDGFIARRFNMRSRLGSMLDPVADKFLMLVSFILLSTLQHISWKLTLLIIGRDLYVSFGALALMRMKIRLYFKPTRVSKLATFSQISVLAFTFLKVLMASEPIQISAIFLKWFELLQIYFIYIAIVLTVVSTFQYTYIGYKFLRYGERSI